MSAEDIEEWFDKMVDQMDPESLRVIQEVDRAMREMAPFLAVLDTLRTLDTIDFIESGTPTRWV